MVPADLDSLDFSSFDHVVFNKPIKTNLINPEKIFIVLNNTWGIYKKEYLEKYISEFPRANFISQNKIKNKCTYSEIFDSIPDYPLASGLQGVQRATLLALKLFNVNRIHIEGFNFFLEDNSYNDWYPSLLEQEHSDKLTGIYMGTIRHDYLLNFMFMKDLLSKCRMEIHGDIIKYINLNPIDVLVMFYKKFSKLNFTSMLTTAYKNANYRK